MGGQIGTDNLPYKIFMPLFGFCLLLTCSYYTGGALVNVRLMLEKTKAEDVGGKVSDLKRV